MRRLGNLLLCILSLGRDEADHGGGSVVPPRTLDRLILVTLLNRGKRPRYIDRLTVLYLSIYQSRLHLFKRVTKTRRSRVLGGTTLPPNVPSHLLLRVLTQQLAKIIRFNSFVHFSDVRNFDALTRRLRQARSSGHPEGMG